MHSPSILIMAALATLATASIAPPLNVVTRDGLLNPPIHISEVLESVFAETGPLAWQNTSDGGQLLTIPTPLYEKHENQALAKRSLSAQSSTPITATRSLFARDSRGTVQGGTSGHRAEWLCYGSGSWAYDSVVSLGVSSACAAFNLGIGSGVTQIWRAWTQRSEVNNQPGPEINVYFKYTGYGILFVTQSECNAVLSHLINGYCQGSYKDFHGGFFDVYQNQANSGSKGSKAYSLHADPQNPQCNC